MLKGRLSKNSTVNKRLDPFQPTPQAVMQCLFDPVRRLQAADKSALLQPSNDPVVNQLFDLDSFQFGIAPIDAIESGSIDASGLERLRYNRLVADLKDIDIIALRIDA